ncbi:hypothetical protein, partial [Streptococcus merionis]|uniref:hypothetical protein n=1 Tax=Streptococcus merionis TaxID=400065 RepID=UPI003517C190
SRLSSALSAQASSLCSSLLDQPQSSSTGWSFSPCRFALSVLCSKALSPASLTELTDSVPPLVFGSSFFLGFTVYISIYGLGCLYLFGRHNKTSSLLSLCLSFLE